MFRKFFDALYSENGIRMIIFVILILAIIIPYLELFLWPFRLDDGNQVFDSYVRIAFLPISLLLYISGYRYLISSGLQFIAKVFWFIMFSVFLVSTAITSYAIVYYLFGAVLHVSNSPSDYLYFSLVTFTTLGYGDLQPREEYRLLASSEALIGYLYLGVIIGLLVNLAQYNKN